MAKKTKPTAFDVKLTPEELKDLGADLAEDISDAFNARSSVIEDGGAIDRADWFYEQGRTPDRDLPFPGAADLTSYFITENVDAMRARLSQAIFGVRPLAFAEARGNESEKAAAIEEFMDWQVRGSDLREELIRTIHGALLEDCYILEVSEHTETRRVKETIDAALATDEQGGALFMDGKPVVIKDEYGDPKRAETGQPSAKVEWTYTRTKRLGPQYDPISMKDFVFLPGHAKSQKHVYGYAYRIWKRLPELKEQVLDGIYDKQAVENLGETSDREEATVPPTVDSVAAQRGPNAEKELMQLSIKRDLDGDGREEWYIVTLSLKTREILRLKLDTFAQRVGMPRCVPFVLFPRRNSVYGYSYFGKLETLAEEHTALRNMKADRQALKTNAPIMQTQDGIWDSNAQPIGIGRVIKVRHPKELTPMPIEDVSSSVVEQERSCIMAKERVGALSDAGGIGASSTERRTATENKIIAAGSGVRVQEVMGHLHASIAKVLKLSHAIWVDTLRAENARPLQAPPSVAQAMQQRGAEDFDGAFTADMIDADVQFEPYGSDQAADPDLQRTMFDRRFMSLTGLAKFIPGAQMVMQDPEVGMALFEDWLRVNDVRNRAPYVNAFKRMSRQPQVPAGPSASPQLGPAPMGADGGMPDMGALMAALGGGGAEGAPSGSY